MAFMYLKVDGIAGGSNDSKHKQEIELQSWGWGLANDGTSDKTAKFQNISISKVVDRSSPLLMKLCSDGAKKEKATLSVDLREKNNLVIEMTPFRIISHRISSGQDEKGKPAMLDHITVKFNKIDIKYVAKDGSNHPFQRDITDSKSG
jgi:type VI secretion system secreted protein Hcp